MSNLWFNIRVGRWFFQSGPGRWVEFKRAYNGAKYDRAFGVYCLFGRHFDA
jgi:hypothetical protein